MAKHRRDEIRREILARLADWSVSPVAAVAEYFGVTRQAVQRHLAAMVDEGLIEAQGTAPHLRYRLHALSHAEAEMRLKPPPEEDRVWREQVRPTLEGLDAEPTDICYYGFTEILNNAIDHSGGRRVRVWAERSGASVRMGVEDDGIGIFRKLAEATRLSDIREVPLELAKGKLTTDPRRHTGEGIFFTSRAFTSIVLESNGISFAYQHREPEPLWTVSGPSDAEAVPDESARGTRVELLLVLPARRPLEAVFAEYSSGPEEYRFSKTHVPLKLAAVGEDTLMSRSSAKRVLARVERFDEATLDFTHVRSIGQAFADEIFRVFASEHPNVHLRVVNANPKVQAMIRRARSHR